MAKVRKGSSKKHLSHGRPPTARKPPASLSSTATRAIIRTHHQLHKALHQAVKDGDEEGSHAIQGQIKASGGLELYQQASITGQSSDRGGDTSKQLVAWLEEASADRRSAAGRLTMLEIGALSPDNACSKSGLFEMARIDLHTQHPNIHQQDFMEMPIPDPEDRFNIISLSLVLNYVPDGAGRGAMLRRTCNFLKPSTMATDFAEGNEALLPSLFLVLPKPCITNSRYLTEAHLCAIMAGLGYGQARKKLTAKLYYSLWTYRPSDQSEPPKPAKAAKILLNPGANRNNFHIILQP